MSEKMPHDHGVTSISAITVPWKRVILKICVSSMMFLQDKKVHSFRMMVLSPTSGIKKRYILTYPLDEIVLWQTQKCVQHTRYDCKLQSGRKQEMRHKTSRSEIKKSLRMLTGKQDWVISTTAVPVSFNLHLHEDRGWTSPGNAVYVFFFVETIDKKWGSALITKFYTVWQDMANVIMKKCENKASHLHQK